MTITQRACGIPFWLKARLATDASMLMSPSPCGTHGLDVGISYGDLNSEPLTLRSSCKYQGAFQHSENRACVLHLRRCLPVGSLCEHRANSTHVARHTRDNLLPRKMGIMFEERCGSSIDCGSAFPGGLQPPSCARLKSAELATR